MRFDADGYTVTLLAPLPDNNGELLIEAEKHFDVLVTIDKKTRTNKT